MADHLWTASLGRTTAASCWGGMTETGSLVLEAAKSRVKEREEEEAQPVDDLEASFIFLVSETLLLWNVDNLCTSTF